MTEYLETVAVSLHSYIHPQCPFCPGEEPLDYTTYPGEANDSTSLGGIMEDPETLTSKQGGCRQKDDPLSPRPGFFNNPCWGPKPKPRPNTEREPFTDEVEWGAYSYEPHHAVAGNEIMDGHPIEGYILMQGRSTKGGGRGLLRKDTGYSINNSDNGVWLPSIPERSKGGLWGTEGKNPVLSRGEKYEAAKLVMEAGEGQFHKGGHTIEDPTGHHRTYPAAGKALLQKVVDHLNLWVDKCFLCKDADPEEGPFPPPYKVNWYIDMCSRSLEAHIRAGVREWRFFISTLAMMYHRDGNCQCGPHT